MCIRKSDHATLNDLIGRALLNEELCQALLKKQTRRDVLAVCELSAKTYRYLMSLADMPSLVVLAEHVYRHLFDPHGCDGARPQALSG